MGEIKFSQIHPRAFAHPLDRKATRACEQLPLFPEVLKKISELRIEQIYRAHHMHHSIQLGPRQCPSLYRMVHEVAERLCVPPPKTYLSRGGGINAFAFGKQAHSIVLTTELVDMMSDRELLGIIAHEMGHILSQHMLFMDVGLALSMRSGAVPSLARLLPGLESTVAQLFFAWFRAAEYTADRAALLILEDPEPLAMCLCRLAGVPRRLESEFDLRLFAEQAKNYEEEASRWAKVVTFGMGSFLSHPEPAKRVAAILEWAESDEYRTILGGRYLTRFEAEAQDQIRIEGVASCPLCGVAIGRAAVCGKCGLVQEPGQQQRCRFGHPNNLDWRFCPACGSTLTAAARDSGTLAY